MLFITDGGSLSRALDLLVDPRLRRLLQALALARRRVGRPSTVRKPNMSQLAFEEVEAVREFESSTREADN
jgi:hypothetical protein